jgi:trans-2,3-dihydro-3-hydroxyanthranilate isomerase
MPRFEFRILNVFAIPGAPLSGNPLCVFEDARGLDDALMQALALQFNLSETTFIFPSDVASARVRIFSPSYEMPFAGHPTLGTAHVVRALRREGPDAALTLELEAGIIPVRAQTDRWTLQAGPARKRSVAATRAQLADMLGLETQDVGPGASWVNTGTEQLIVPLTAASALLRMNPVPELIRQHAALSPERQCVYAFAERAPGVMGARFFFNKGASVVEDPATGSACANLGGYLWAIEAPRAFELSVEQGELTGRPSRLGLHVDEHGQIFVSGQVFELGRGSITLQ